jgi:hypothetical protein
MQQFARHTCAITIMMHQPEVVSSATHYFLLYVSGEDVLNCRNTRIYLMFIQNTEYPITNWVPDIEDSVPSSTINNGPFG